MRTGDVFVVAAKAPLFMADTVTPLGAVYARKFDIQKGATGGLEAFPVTTDWRVLFNAQEFSGDYSTIQVDGLPLAEFVLARQAARATAQHAEGQPVLQTEAQLQALQARLKLENTLKGGVSWFYWIAGLSVINSLLQLLGLHWSFFAGLGSAQVVDGIAAGIAQQLALSWGWVVRGVGFGFTLALASLFALCGRWAGQRHTWAFVVGMGLYGLDGLFFLFAQDFLGGAFHLFVLYGLYTGLRANQQLGRQFPVSRPVADG